MNARFDEIAEAEYLCQSEKAGAALGTSEADRERAKRNWSTARARLSALLDAMSMEELAAYGEYRRTSVKPIR